MCATSVKQSDTGEKKLQGYSKAPPCCSITPDFGLGKASIFSDCVPETAKHFFILSCTDTACLDQEVLCAVSHMCLKIVQFKLVTQEERLNTLEAEIRTVSSLGSYFQITISFPLKSNIKTDFTAVHRGPVNIFLSSLLCKKLITYLQKESGVAEEPHCCTQQRFSIKAASFQTSRVQVLLVPA